MKILLIDNGTKDLSELQSLIPGPEITQQFYNKPYSDIDSYDLIILSGSSIASAVWNHVHFNNELALIQEAKVPVIGICFGSELITCAFGGTLQELREPHTGMREILVLDKSFSSEEKLVVYENHKWITGTLPLDFTVLAKSSDGPEVFKHVTRPIYGFQFHPEMCAPGSEARHAFLRIIEEMRDRK